MTPDTSIEPHMYNIHIPELAPPRKLLGDYYKRGLPWDEYEKQYLEYIRQPEKIELIKELMIKHKNITFLCIEENDEHCHRRLLKSVCDEIEGTL